MDAEFVLVDDAFLLEIVLQGLEVRPSRREPSKSPFAKGGFRGNVNVPLRPQSCGRESLNRYERFVGGLEIVLQGLKIRPSRRGRVSPPLPKGDLGGM